MELDEKYEKIRARDRILAEEGVPPHARKMRVLVQLGLELGEPFAIGPDGPSESLELVSKYFDNVYGRKALVDPCHGYGYPVVLDGDIYQIKTPKVFGNALGPQVFSRLREQLKRGTPPYLLFRFVEGLTDAKRKHLEQHEFKYLIDSIEISLGLRAAFEEVVGDNELFSNSKFDMSNSCNILVSRMPHFAQSRWATLQGLEKFIKGCAKPFKPSGLSKVHTLKDLVNQLEDSWGEKCSPNVRMYCEEVKCTPGSRYGDENATRDQAITSFTCAALAIISLSKTFLSLQPRKPHLFDLLNGPTADTGGK